MLKRCVFLRDKEKERGQLHHAAILSENIAYIQVFDLLNQLLVVVFHHSDSNEALLTHSRNLLYLPLMLVRSSSQV